MPISLRAGSDRALGEERFTIGSIEAKIREMRQRVQERSQEGERSAFLEDLGRNLDEISASLEELRPTSAGEAPFHGMNSDSLDVTEQKIAETEIRKMTRTVEASPTAIVLTDLEGKIEYVNPSLLKKSGFRDASQMKGQVCIRFHKSGGQKQAARRGHSRPPFLWTVAR